jgi:hypothetical protein
VWQEALAHPTMLNPNNCMTIRMFKCECGEQTWREDQE